MSDDITKKDDSFLVCGHAPGEDGVEAGWQFDIYDDEQGHLVLSFLRYNEGEQETYVKPIPFAVFAPGVTPQMAVGLMAGFAISKPVSGTLLDTVSE